MRHPYLLFLFALVLGACAVPARRDDVHEPNDRRAQATFLRPGRGLELRANQGNPDVIAFEVDSAGPFSLLLRSRGLENCATLQLVGPENEILYQDRLTACGSLPLATIQTEGISLLFDEDDPDSYELLVEGGQPGRYHLTVIEGSASERVPSSWDYSVRLRVR